MNPAAPSDESEHRPASTARRGFLAATLAAGGAVCTAEAAGAATALLPEDPTVSTRLTRRHGLRHPFVGAGMGFVSGPPLVAAVCEAGGLGVLGNGVQPPALTQTLIQQVKLATRRPFGVDFVLDDAAFGPLTVEAHLDVCIAERVRLVVFHMNLPPSAWVRKLQAAGADVWAQVGSLAQAQAAAALGVDALVVQGREAGGHHRSTEPLAELLRQVSVALPAMTILAAGGITDGSDVADALLQGADGVWVGTRLVASFEANAHPEYQARLLAASGDDATVTTTMFGPEYPNRPYRVLRNRVVAQWAGHEDRIPNPPPPPAVIGQTLLFNQPYAMPKFSAIVPTRETRGDFEEMGLPAGAGVTGIRSLQPAGQIVATMMRDAHRRLHAWMDRPE